MTKEELISQYPVDIPSTNEEILYLILAIIFLVVGLILTIIIRHEMPMLIGLVSAAFLFTLSHHIWKTSSQEEFYNKSMWRVTFEDKYLSDLTPTKFNIKEITVGKEGIINCLINTDLPVKTVYSKEIYYYESSNKDDKGYILANYIDDLTKYGIKENFYNVKIYLPNN